MPSASTADVLAPAWFEVHENLALVAAYLDAHSQDTPTETDTSGPRS